MISCAKPVSANNNSISVAGLAFVCAGHVAHHMRIIRERYLGDQPPVQEGKTRINEEEKEKSGRQKIACSTNVFGVHLAERVICICFGLSLSLAAKLYTSS
jgi:hypothetical protein